MLLLLLRTVTMGKRHHFVHSYRRMLCKQTFRGKHGKKQNYVGATTVYLTFFLNLGIKNVDWQTQLSP